MGSLETLDNQAPPGGLEPPTPGLGIPCSIRLSYGGKGLKLLKDSNRSPLVIQGDPGYNQNAHPDRFSLGESQDV